MSSTVNKLSELKGHRAKCPLPFFFVVILLGYLFSPLSTYGQDKNDYINYLISTARDRKLHQKRQWLKLLHYHPTLFGLKSAIDDPEFFLSPRGSTDPLSELIATIKGLFSPINDQGRHPRCRFPARTEWLKKELSIDEGMLPEVQCKDLDEFMSAVNPAKAYLVFASYYMGSPASMYGHTLLLISPGDTTSKLLSFGANYAADARDTNAVLYIFKGLFGFYKGFFTVHPYYDKIRQYANMEHRDLWEYELNLTPEEVRFMTLHLWEMKNIYSYYYFFDENCSYHLLFLIDAARPEAGLTDRHSLWVIPVDTIRWAYEAGLISSVTFRPSKATLIKALAKGLKRELKITAIDVAEGRKSPDEVLESKASRTDRARTLELSSELIEVQYLKKSIDQKEYQKKLLGVLRARTSLGITEPVKPETPPRPETGHDSSRTGIGTGVRDDRGFLEFSYRAAYHDLYDPDAGYLPHSEIVFGEIRFRYENSTESVHLQSLVPLSIHSLAERTLFFKPVSWFVRFGYQRTETPEGLSGAMMLNTGGGLTWNLPVLGTTFVFGQAEAFYSRALKKNYTIGAGIRAGVIRDIHEFLKAGMELHALTYELGDKNRTYSANATVNIKILKDLSLRLSFQRTKTFDRYHSETGATVYVYF